MSDCCRITKNANIKKWKQELASLQEGIEMYRALVISIANKGDRESMLQLDDIGKRITENFQEQDDLVVLIIEARKETPEEIKTRLAVTLNKKKREAEEFAAAEADRPIKRMKVKLEAAGGSASGGAGGSASGGAGGSASGGAGGSASGGAGGLRVAGGSASGIAGVAGGYHVFGGSRKEAAGIAFERTAAALARIEAEAGDALSYMKAQQT
jgi:hypothetical protein